MNLVSRVKRVIALSLVFLCAACSNISPITRNTSMTDDNITDTVQTRFTADEGLSSQAIHVNTFERVVTLEGSVDNPTQADIAIALARSVPGVKYVRAKISVKSPSAE